MSPLANRASFESADCSCASTSWGIGNCRPPCLLSKGSCSSSSPQVKGGEGVVSCVLSNPRHAQQQWGRRYLVPAFVVGIGVGGVVVIVGVRHLDGIHALLAAHQSAFARSHRSQRAPPSLGARRPPKVFGVWGLGSRVGVPHAPAAAAAADAAGGATY